MLGQACRKRIFAACTEQAHRYRKGLGTKVDLVRAEHLLEHACKHGEKRACKGKIVRRGNENDLIQENISL